MTRQKLLIGLNDEQIVKVKACKNQDELLELAKQEGVELNDEQLEAVSGGGCVEFATAPACPYCKSIDTFFSEGHPTGRGDGSTYNYYCNACRRYYM